MQELEHRLTLIGSRRFTIAPRAPADLIGVVRLSVKPGGLRENTVEVPGQDGSTRTVLGYADAEITAEIQIWEVEQMANIKKLADIFRPRREQKNYQPVQIIAPAANRWGIKNAYIFEIQATPWSAREGATITLQMREWKSREQRKTKKTKPVSGSPGTADFSFLEGRDIAAPSTRGAPRP